MSGKPLEFCAHLARSVHTGRKTVTWKPLAPADLKRRAEGYTSNDVLYPVGSISDVYEPWGKADGETVLMSKFASEIQGGPSTPPPGFRQMPGSIVGGKAEIVGCALVRLHDITDEEAALAGMAPADGSQNYRAEFERQWRDNYRGVQGWDANPLCWRIVFRLHES